MSYYQVRLCCGNVFTAMLPINGYTHHNAHNQILGAKMSLVREEEATLQLYIELCFTVDVKGWADSLNV